MTTATIEDSQIEESQENEALKQFIMRVYKKIEATAEKSEKQMNEILAQIKSVADKIEKERCAIKIDIDNGLGRVGAVVTRAVADAKTSLTFKEKELTTNKWRNWGIALVVGLASGGAGALIEHHFIPEMSAEMQHELAIGNLLKAAWPEISQADKDKIEAVRRGEPIVDDPKSAAHKK